MTPDFDNEWSGRKNMIPNIGFLGSCIILIWQLMSSIVSFIGHQPLSFSAVIGHQLLSFFALIGHKISAQIFCSYRPEKFRLKSHILIPTEFLIRILRGIIATEFLNKRKN